MSRTKFYRIAVNMPSSTAESFDAKLTENILGELKAEESIQKALADTGLDVYFVDCETEQTPASSYVEAMGYQEYVSALNTLKGFYDKFAGSLAFQDVASALNRVMPILEKELAPKED